MTAASSSSLQEAVEVSSKATEAPHAALLLCLEIANYSSQPKSDKPPKYDTRLPNEKKWGFRSKPAQFSQQFRHIWVLSKEQRQKLNRFSAEAIQGEVDIPAHMNKEKLIEIFITSAHVSLRKHSLEDEQKHIREQKKLQLTPGPIRWLALKSRSSTKARKENKAYSRSTKRPEYQDAVDTYFHLMRDPVLAIDLRRQIAKGFLSAVRANLLDPRVNNGILARMTNTKDMGYWGGHSDKIPETTMAAEIVNYDELIAFAQEGWELHQHEATFKLRRQNEKGEWIESWFYANSNCKDLQLRENPFSNAHEIKPET